MGIFKIIQQDSLRYINPETNEFLSTQKLINCEIKDDMFSCQDYTEYFCFVIQKKMNVLDRLHVLVRTLNINYDDNEAKVCGILTKFIIKLTYLFFLIIGEKSSTNIPLNKNYYLRKYQN